MSAYIIDGKAVAADLRQTIAVEVDGLSRSGIVPGLAVILVGSDPASDVYVRSKGRQTVEVGMQSFEYRLGADISELELLALIDSLNQDERVDGILVQLPLPRHIDTARVLRSIEPTKDVDGFHPINVGLAATGANGMVPCTPLGCLLLLRAVHPTLSGLAAVVVGRSNIVGKPVATLLLGQDCTVTIAHSRTQDLAAVVRSADIVVAAVGRPEMIRGDWIKPGATVIDVGINRVPSEGRGRLVGDVAFDEAVRHAGAITPVPGGVGPMTIACLLRNTVTAARRRHEPSSVDMESSILHSAVPPG